MRRRDFIGAIAGSAVVWPLAAHTEQGRRIYADERTIAITYLSAEGHGERFPALAAECVRLNADVIAVSTTPAAQAAKNATRTIPIVMLALGDPLGTGLVDSLARPGGNVTGVSQMTSDLAAKRFELLKEAVPGISRVLVLAYLADPIAPLQVNALKEAARSLGVTLQIQAATTCPPRSMLEPGSTLTGSSRQPRIYSLFNAHE